ncbi:DUF2149 domain-containing protein [Desulfobulbus rhabdoformis]|jgi:hypothetical protein|uniref:DUF2149 domain-containing protein n=1 Tax=Desulfobulbus rhabdoformis TaxID=34032 RepID=UPI0019626AE1|nr:DUF2149 domain-containing protein [Desulfobulbus rhabdoformis]MBM9614819.1 DUF2149 domain-containing protein [Desulfobulbus rhabdoformis]
MRYFRSRRSSQAGKGFSDMAFRDDDPMTGVANLFDIGLVFIVGLILTLFSVYRLQDLFDENSEMTIMKQQASGEMEIIVKKGTQITATRVTKETAQGKGNRLGVAYQLEDGSMVYVPDTSKP